MRPDHVYYNCEPRKNLGPKWSDLFPEHPTSIYVREDRLVGGTLEYMQERVFGPKRKELVEAELKELDKSGLEARQTRIEALRGSLEELVTRQERQILALEREDDPDGLIYRRIRERIVDLEGKRERIQEELKELSQPLEDEIGDPDLLDGLPILHEDLSIVPEEFLRPLLEAVRLSLKVNKLTGKVLIELMIDEAGAQMLSGFSTNAFSAPKGKHTAWVTHIPDGLGAHQIIAAEFAVPSISSTRKRQGERLGHAG